MQYHELVPEKARPWKTASGDHAMYLGETAKATVHFRNGKEVVEAESVKDSPARAGGQFLKTVGTFGPILATVIAAATTAHSELTWSRWEEGPNGQLAVFRYRVPQETPLFYTGFCCLAIDDAMVPFNERAPFHGEFAIDPETGAIFRLTMQADLAWRLPQDRSGVMVEYSQVVKGAKTYICPSRSVSISRQRRVINIEQWGEEFKVYAPFETILSEMTFDRYHIFGSTSRILPGFTPVEDK